MEKGKFERAIAINKRLKDLDDVLTGISPKSLLRLSYVDYDNNGMAEWSMRIIGNLLDKHDEMIRAEIQQEIDSLHSEIETL